MLKKFTDMTPEQSFFAVFCVEELAQDLKLSAKDVYKMLTDDSDVLDAYIVPHYDVLHTQGGPWIVEDLKEVLRGRGTIQ